MLHALLHRKLDPAIPEPKRLEVVVTSTVFGTLLVAGADATLAAWFATATAGTSPEPVIGPLRGCWFWPRMAHAEPDVVLAMGAHLIVVEAKVRSGRNDLAAVGVEPNVEGDDADTGSDLLDQICRQWDSLCRAADTPGLPRDLRAAAHGASPCLFYLVDARRLAKASRQINESRALLASGADLRILTWQSLHRILHRLVAAGTAPRWASDLAAYLDYEHLAGFVGFTHLDSSAVSRAAMGLHELTLVRGAQQLRWQVFCQRLTGTAASALFAWSCRHEQQAQWGIVRTGTDAGILIRAGTLVRTVPIAGGLVVSPHHTRRHLVSTLSTPTTTTPAAEFASAVATTIEAIQHLYAEIDRLNETLLTRLLEEPTAFSFLGGTPVDPGDRSDRLDRRIRDQYHFLLSPGLDEAAELDEGEGDDEDESVEASVMYRTRRLTRKRGRATIRAGEPCLAVSVVLHGQRQTAIGPHLRAMVLTDWRVGSAAPKDGQFQMAHHILTRMLRSIEVAPDVDISRRLATRGKAYATSGKASQVAVSTRLAAPPQIIPLIELASIEAVEAFVDDVKERWRRMSGGTETGA